MRGIYCFWRYSLCQPLKAKTDCSEIMKILSSANEALSNSIQQMKQVTNPTEDFVIERLTGLPNIVELASFDGAGFLASGSHSVVGTVVIRTSDNLTATQQKEMEANIYNSLVELR